MTTKEEIVASLVFRIDAGTKEVAFHQAKIQEVTTRISQLNGALAELYTLKEMAEKEAWPATDEAPKEEVK